MAGQPGDTKVLSTLSVLGDGDVPVARSQDVLGAIQIVQDTTERDAIPDAVRKVGLLSYVVGVDTFFQLKGGVVNTNWVAVTLGGSSGPVVDVFATLVNGQTVFNLSQSPANPNEVVVILNGVAYTLPGGGFLLGGAGNQILSWAGPQIDTSDAPILIRYAGV